MKLYTVFRCPFGHRASIALREKNLAFETGFFTPAARPAELLAISPFAKSPTLVDGDTNVYDSLVVLEYLEDRYPERPLMPRDAAGRARVRLLIARVGEELFPYVGAIAREKVHKTTPDEAAVTKALEGFLRALEGWDHMLEGRAFVAGDALTFADIVLFTPFPSLQGLLQVGIPPERTHLRSWLDRMTARPSTPLLTPS